ncbi:hypothetical protein [Pseudoxanthobacter soli]|uniref:hypothetical protein n=1 Tax=Pseudoxanthobacter soli TaxID=433840 RepID=UPI001114A0D4|nr:hypothetical protein [Pseudoxanthobacter soli]
MADVQPRAARSTFPSEALETPDPQITALTTAQPRVLAARLLLLLAFAGVLAFDVIVGSPGRAISYLFCSCLSSDNHDYA